MFEFQVRIIVMMGKRERRHNVEEGKEEEEVENVKV